MVTKHLIIDGMNCKHCVMAVKEELENIGITEHDVAIGKAKITFDEEKITDTKIAEAIDEAGFELKGIE